MGEDDLREEVATLKKEVSKLRLETNLRKSLANELEKQKKVANTAKAELEEKHRNLISSLNYAARIQTSILPSRAALDRLFPGHFIFWEPQNIVGGDAYFLHLADMAGSGTPASESAAAKPKAGVFSVYDCTGHGVPGAFMTLLGERALETGCGLAAADDARAGGILSHVDDFIRREVNAEDGTEANDGMDCLVLDVGTDGSCRYASANFTLFGQTADGFVELETDEASVGYRLEAGETAPEFTTRRLDLSRFRSIVIASDGILDQVGGPKGLSLGRRRLTAMLAAATQAPGSAIPIDGDAVVTAIRDYQGAREQRDDMTLIILPC